MRGKRDDSDSETGQERDNVICHMRSAIVHKKYGFAFAKFCRAPQLVQVWNENYIHILEKKFATDIWLQSVRQDKIDTQTNAVNHEPLPNSIRVLRCDDIRRQGLSCSADIRED
jgi:hypothetical protein